MTENTTVPEDRARTTLRDALRQIWDEVAAQFAIDRTGIARRDVPARAKVAAWAAIAGIYLVGWSEGVRVAVVMLLGWTPVPDTWPTGTVATATAGIVRQIAVVLMAAALIWAFRRYAGAEVQRATWRTGVKTFPVGYLAVFIGFTLAGALSTVFGLPSNEFDLAPIDDPLLHVLNIVNDGMAGPSEELALLALVVVALRATGHSWTVVLIAAIAVRVPFHLYYGWGAIGLAAWALLMVLLYRRTGAIVALILEHATFNMLTYAGAIGWSLKLIFTLSGLVVVGVVLTKSIAQREKAAAEKP
ncbi:MULTISPECIES: CPBP family glutamic-type intramembrane protease [Microbacterium]|uniref:CPBP family glutamic-type intramembrane protease n=1 Tax=Microbacterium TaxID=33882 RepID=UPI0010F644E5|nr:MULTISPECIES: CPBP family glutamic-type intramembrane protease [unclassified Microbacterium]